jgi:hypothetical protein
MWVTALLPDQVTPPVVNDEYDATYGTIFGITSDGFTLTETREMVDNIQRQLRTVKDIGKTIQVSTIQPTAT